MRAVECGACGMKIRESDAEWDLASESGRCPGCGRLFDLEAERAATALSSGDEYISRNRRRRLGALVAGLLLIPVDVLLVVTRLGHLALMSIVLTASLLAAAVFINPRRQARQDLGRSVDLDRWSRPD